MAAPKRDPSAGPHFPSCLITLISDSKNRMKKYAPNTTSTVMNPAEMSLTTNDTGSPCVMLSGSIVPCLDPPLGGGVVGSTNGRLLMATVTLAATYTLAFWTMPDMPANGVTLMTVSPSGSRYPLTGRCSCNPRLGCTSPPGTPGRRFASRARCCRTVPGDDSRCSRRTESGKCAQA